MPVTTQSTLCPNCSGAQCSSLTQQWWQWCDLSGMQQAISVTVVLLFLYGQTHFCVWTPLMCCPPCSGVFQGETSTHTAQCPTPGLSCWQGDVVPNRHLQCRIEHKRVSALHLYGNQQEILQVKQEVASPAFLQERGPKLSGQEGKSTLLWLRGPFSYYLPKYPGTVIYH